MMIIPLENHEYLLKILKINTNSTKWPGSDKCKKPKAFLYTNNNSEDKRGTDFFLHHHHHATTE